MAYVMVAILDLESLLHLEIPAVSRYPMFPGSLIHWPLFTLPASVFPKCSSCSYDKPVRNFLSNSNSNSNSNNGNNGNEKKNKRLSSVLAGSVVLACKIRVALNVLL